MTRTINAAGRLDRLPISRFHWKILGLIAGGAFLDAFDIYLANGAVASMVKEGFTDLRHGAIFVSSTFIGMMIGAFAAGYLGDRLGRRYSYQLNLAVFGLASLAACFAPNIEWLIVLRLVMGIGLGAELVVAAGTLAEFVPPATRGKWVSLLAVITNSGLFAALAAGYWIIPHLGWRYMFALAGIGALAVWFLRKRMPESPRWLESVGRLDEAEATLASIEQQVRAQHGELPPVERAVSLNVGKVPISRLFAPDMRARLLVAALTAIGVNVGLYGFVAWLPTFFVAEGLSVVKSLGFVFFMSIGSPVGGLIGYVVADRWGPRAQHRGGFADQHRAGLDLRDAARRHRDRDGRLRAGQRALHDHHARAVRLYPRAVPHRGALARHRRCGHCRARLLDRDALPRPAALSALRRVGRDLDGQPGAGGAVRGDRGAARRD